MALTEFTVDGQDSTPAIAMRLQDGFVVGLTRSAPIYVVDTIDVARYMGTYPELQKCDGSICIKRLGQVLGVSHLVRVTATITGNSYKMTSRLFSTEGSAPALVPVDTQSRACPVCTADEARQNMVLLGEASKAAIEAWLVDARRPPPPPPPPKTWRRPLAAVAVAAGFASVVTGSALLVNLSDGDKKLPALAGLMIGMGASVAVVGVYVLVTPAADGPTHLPHVALAFTW